MDILGAIGGTATSFFGYLLPFLFVLLVVVFVHELGLYVAFSHSNMGKTEQAVSNGQFVDSFPEDIIMRRCNILKK